MNALISGRTGHALLVDGGPLWLVNLEAPRKLVSVNPSAIRLLFGNSSDTEVLEDTDIKSVMQVLEQKHREACAMDLILISFDSQLSRELRSEALCALEELVGDRVLLNTLENLLYGQPVPRRVDLGGAVKLCYAHKLSMVREVLQAFLESQPGIREVRLAWDSIQIGVFGDAASKLQFERIGISEGLFRSLAIARGSGSKVDQFRVSFMLNPAITALPNHRDVLQEWVRPFLDQRHRQKLIRDLSPEDELQSDPSGEPKRPRSFDRLTHFEKTNSQKEAIVKAMRRRDHVRVRNLVGELISHHMSWDGPRYAVMSLCDLAIEAKSIGAYALQLELTERCIELRPHDAWSWSQYSDALLRNQRMSEALVAYEQAFELGAGVIARDGKAQVLKSMGRLEDALKVCDETIADFPMSVVTRINRAELLKAQWRLDQAADAYESIIADEPGNMVARRGRAEVLKAQSLLDEALDSYDHLISENPGDIIARAGRAGVLKAMWRFDEALDQYDAVIADDPTDVVVRNGRADLLKTMWRLDEALASFDQIVAEFPENVFAMNGRADVLRLLGRLDEALDSYDEIIAQFPESLVSRRGRAEVLKDLGRLHEARTTYDEITREFPENLFADSGRLGVLRALGEFDAALDSYDRLVVKNPYNLVVRTSRAEVLKEMGRLDEALASYNAIIQEHPHHVVVRNGRAGVLRALRRIDEALDSYNSVIADFPRNLFARGGRAECLRSLNRLDDALAAYDAIIADYPQDAIARRARSAVLLQQRRFDDALIALPEDRLVTQNDWIGFHLRGTVLLKMGCLDDAVDVFERGLRDAPSIIQKQYFRTSLAVTKVKLRDFAEAKRVLAEVTMPQLQTQVAVLQLHSAGELEEYEYADAAFQSLMSNPGVISDELVAELHRRYILKEEPSHDDEWVNQQEIELSSMIAFQYAVPSLSYSSQFQVF
jgi:tetratricopeptide (TPR) repeat protein